MQFLLARIFGNDPRFLLPTVKKSGTRTKGYGPLKSNVPKIAKDYPLDDIRFPRVLAEYYIANLGLGRNGRWTPINFLTHPH
jgi:hypothetical protein